MLLSSLKEQNWDIFKLTGQADLLQDACLLVNMNDVEIGLKADFSVKNHLVRLGDELQPPPTSTYWRLPEHPNPCK